MRLRRKSAASDADTPDVDLEAAEAESDATESAVESTVEPTAALPVDVEDLTEEEIAERVDLGSLLVAPAPGKELRLQVDEASGTVQSVLIAGADGVAELRAFAAPRNGDLWSEVRPAIAADMARRGGTATETDGPFGVELRCEITATLEDGRTGTQLSRIIGVNGSRWLLRATLLGEPARGGDSAAEWEAVLGGVAVRRGQGALPPGEALPLVLPEQARRLEPGQ